MRRHLFPAFLLLFAFLSMEVRADDQASSGNDGDGYASSGDESNEGSGFNGQEVQKVIETMRKINKNKSDEDLSKNIKTGKYLKNLPLRTFEKLSALWISIIRRLWKVWRAKGARQVMHSIVEKLVTHTGEKVSNQVANILKASSDSGDTASLQKSAMPVEKNVSEQTGYNETTTVAQPGSDAPGEEDTDSNDKPTYAGTRTPANSRGNQESAQQATTGQETNTYYNGNQVSPAIQSEQKLVGYQNTAIGSATAAKTETRTDAQSSFEQNQAHAQQQTNAKITEEKDAVTDAGSGARNMVPQEQTPESITANIEMPAEAIVHKSSKKVKHTKSKKRYKTHRHSRTANKSSKHTNKQQKETRVRYKNVDKHLIRKFNKHDVTVPGNELSWTQGSSYEAPISKQLQSVLSAKVARETAFSKVKSNHRKRSFTTENRRSNIEHAAFDDYDDYGYDYTNDDSGDESSGKIANSRGHDNRRVTGQFSKGKKKRVSKKLKNSKTTFAKRKNALSSSKQNGQAVAKIGNKTMPTKPAKYEAPVRKFKFFGAPRQNVEVNNTTAVPILNIESAPTKTPTQGETASESGDTQPGQELQLGNGWAFKQPGQFGVAGQPSETPPVAMEPAPGQNMDGSPMLLLRPPVPQPEDGESPIILPTVSGKPIVPIVPTEPPSLPGEEDDENSENNDNSTSFLHPEDNSGPSAYGDALTEEVKSLESRMTVVEAAVAEIIEWIRSRSQRPQNESPIPAELMPGPSQGPANFPNLGLRPAMSEEEPAAPQDLLLPHHRRLLKQIFIPLPAPNTEAEKEIESGEPINGLPYPLNFIVTKILAKMLRQRDEKIMAAAHPHTPLPDVDIPAIEHDINRLEMELGSVPKPFHHHKHHQFKLHRPETEEKVKSPLIGQLIGPVAESEGPACSAPCENGGICLGNNICRCPPPFSGPSCGSVTLVKVAKPTRRIMIEAPGVEVLGALRRRAMNQHAERFLPAQIRDHRSRRMLVQVLKRLLQNIATEDVRPEYTRRNNIDMDNMANGLSDNFVRGVTAG
ncbi:uncharacterized protein LOC135695368 isoform X1 [Rhopilema esculentum]|uniref:uncharacterized protein LOC135695368 isoform X1 n=1 Tax=Rhopilema esculentum TaxID=499914 RepID=UPI0031DF7542